MQLTMLNAMAGADFEIAAQRHTQLGLKWLDLKDGLWGEAVDNLSLENARRIRMIAHAHGLRVHCLSSSPGYSNIEGGEVAFRTRHLPTLDHVLRVAEILQPQVVRLLGAKLVPQSANESIMSRVEQDFPWVLAVYRQMIERIRAAGLAVGIENEVQNCILATPNEIQRFFELVSPDGTAYFIYDVQNLWQMGTFPCLEVYRQLRPLLGGLHLKGGRSGDDQTLKWAAPLEEASWPVVEIVRAALADNVAPVVCLNPSHGEKPPGYDTWQVAQQDIAFLRREIQGIE